MEKLTNKNKYRKFLAALFVLLIGTNVLAVEAEDVLPFNKKHLVYPNFEAELKTVTAYIQQSCHANVDKLDPSIKDDYLITCQFPKLIEQLKIQTDAANKLLASDDMQLRNSTLFLDLEYGWLNQDIFSLLANPEKHIVNIIVLKQAIQKSIPSISRMWQRHHGVTSLQGRIYTLPKLAAGMERDLLLTRAFQYAKSIQCIEPLEIECMNKKYELLNMTNGLINKYQRVSVDIPASAKAYINVSTEFRQLLNDWINQNQNPIQMLNAIQQGLIPKALMNKYKELIRLPKVLENPNLNQNITLINVTRYLKEQEQEFNNQERQATPQIQGIFIRIEKQMEMLFPNKI